MQVRVRLFATLRQMAGWSEREIEVPEGSTVGDLMARLEETYPALALKGRTLYAAVNQEYTRGERQLAPGDEIALLPPVSGGWKWQRRSRRSCSK
jgi:molybdopterin synthase catalytic subunit